MVALFAALDAGGAGIFTGPDALAEAVIRVGDPLFGSTVTGLFFFSEGLNDAGQLAFRATLADGRDVIVRADPVPVPEPSTLTLVGLAALGGLLYRWRRLGRAA